MTSPTSARPTIDFPVSRIREDFPIFSRQIHGRPLVYLDNAATRQIPRQVADAMTKYVYEQHANVHRGVHSLSQHATDLFESARDTLRDWLGASRREEIVWTHGTTEATNLIAFGWARHQLQPGDEIIVSGLEHHANFLPWQQVARETGATFRVLPVCPDGTLDMDAWQDMLSERTRLVAVAHASNALGTLNPVKEMADMARRVGAVTVVDGAQTIPHMPIDVQDLGCDFFVFSGHKMCGPTGVGACYGKWERLLEMEPLLVGGGIVDEVSLTAASWLPPPHRLEAGTPPLASVMGLQAACVYLNEVGMDAIATYESQLTAYMQARLANAEGVRLIGPTTTPRVGVFSFAVDALHPYDLGQALDLEGIAIRTGNHCAQPLMQFLNEPGTARASIAFTNTFDEIDAVLDGIPMAREMFGG
jgi:cysteine desulfurase/selenocysteine lyase